MLGIRKVQGCSKTTAPGNYLGQDTTPARKFEMVLELQCPSENVDAMARHGHYVPLSQVP